MPDSAEGCADERRWAFVGLGSNVGDRVGHLRAAIRQFRGDAAIDVRRISPVYETEAHTLGGAGSGSPFLNAVVEIVTSLAPAELLERCLVIERAAGRDRAASERWSPRTLDLDLLLFGDQSIQERRLTVPHPRLPERLFVLRPLADIALDVHVPLPIDASVRDLLAACEDRSWVRRTGIRLDDRSG